MDDSKPYSLLDEMIGLTPATSRTAPGGVVKADLGDSYIVELSLDEWLKFKDHPRRRDPERQAKKLHWEDGRYSRGEAAVPHRFVVGAFLENDGLYKVDGHCRSLLWKQGTLPTPFTICATVIRCRSRQALLDLRQQYDNASAAQTSTDNVSAALHEYSLVFGSSRLRTFNWSEALEIAVRGKPLREGLKSNLSAQYDPFAAVECFRSELKILDDCEPPAPLFLTGHVAAALLALAENFAAREFFSLYAKGLGKQRRGELDPISYLTYWTEQARLHKSSWLKHHQTDVCGLVLALVNRFLQGPDSPGWWIPRNATEPVPVDVEVVAERVQRAKDRLLGR